MTSCAVHRNMKRSGRQRHAESACSPHDSPSRRFPQRHFRRPLPRCRLRSPPPVGGRTEPHLRPPGGSQAGRRRRHCCCCHRGVSGTGSWSCRAAPSPPSSSSVFQQLPLHLARTARAEGETGFGRRITISPPRRPRRGGVFRASSFSPPPKRTLAVAGIATSLPAMAHSTSSTQREPRCSFWWALQNSAT